MLSKRIVFLLTLLASLGLAFGPSHAQPVPTWKNDAQGRPAPPCFTLDPVTGISTPCPPPTGGANSPATGTTIISEGGQSTAFGNTWFTGGPIDSSPSQGPGCVFLSDTQIACAGQQAGSVTSIRVYQSTDGGVSLPLTFTTASTPGNLNITGQLVKTPAGPYYMGLTANGAFGNNPLRSIDLNVWTATSGITAAFPADGTFHMAVGGPTGNTVLTFTTTTARICRVVSPAIAFGCTAPVGFTALDGPNAVAHVTGSTWVLIDGSAVANVFRSTDDGATWAVAATLTGTKSAIGGANLVCPTTTICIAQVGDSIYRSTDAGLTWGAPVATGDTDWNVLINFGGGNIIALGTNLSVATPQPGCLPNCQNIPPPDGIRTTDNGVTWVSASAPWLTSAGTGGDVHTAIARSNGSAIVTHTRADPGPLGAGTGRSYGYTTTLPSGVKVLSRGEIPVIPIQGGLLLNSQTTGAAATPVVVTLTGVAGFRVHLWSLSARCGTGADTATITVAEGVTTRYSSAFTQVALVTQNSFDKTWPTGLTIADGTNMVITLGACTAGAGTLIVQADQF